MFPETFRDLSSFSWFRNATGFFGIFPGSFGVRSGPIRTKSPLGEFPSTFQDVSKIFRDPPAEFPRSFWEVSWMLQGCFRDRYSSCRNVTNAENLPKAGSRSPCVHASVQHVQTYQPSFEDKKPSSKAYFPCSPYHPVTQHNREVANIPQSFKSFILESQRQCDKVN